MALAEYNDLYWFPDGSLARNVPARVFPEFSNDFAPLYADAAGTLPLPNPINTDNDGRLRFWVEAGVYWISIDQESIRVPIGTGEQGVTPQQVDEKIAEHNADTTGVHGIPDTSQLLTSADVDGLATDAELQAHVNATTAVHGIADTAALETQTGAQAKATAAQAAAEATAAADAQGKVNEARGELEEEIAAGDQAQADALAAHAAATTNVHGIPDTATIPTNAQFEQVSAELAAHEADTTAVHGIPDTSQLATSAQVDTVSGGLAAHVADTTGVHGIADTSQLLTTVDLEQYATDAELAAHAADTTAVHGIADTSQLLTSADVDGLATDAEVAQVQSNLDAHAADTTAVHGIPDTAQLATQSDLTGYASETELQAHTNATTAVHGIADTAALLTQTDLDAYATDTELAAHAADTTAVHGIADTAALETQTGAQAKANTGRDAAIADAATKYLNRVNGGTVTGPLAVADAGGGVRWLPTGGMDVSRDTTLSYWSGPDFTGVQTPLMRWEAGGPHLVGHVQLGSNPFDSVFDFDTAAARATFNGDLTVMGDLVADGVTDWLNARRYGALGDGTTDDTAALQAAIDACPPGGVVYMPDGDYRTSSPLYPRPGVTILMPRASLMLVAGITDPPCRIRPLPTFTGEAVLIFRDQTGGGYPSIPAEHRLINVQIDGAAYTATGLDGIMCKGNVQNVVMEHVTIRQMSNNGIYTGDLAGVFPYSWRLSHVMLDNNHGNGAIFTVMTDLTMLNCQGIGNWGSGFVLNNLANSQLVGCRAEWNGNHGYHLTGNWGTGTGSGGMQMSACATDRNGFNGVYVDATGNTPIVISNLMTRRDGRNGGAGGGGYAGVAANAATVPLTIGDWTNYPGVDDNGTQTSSPDYGASFTNCTLVQLENAYLHAALAGLHDGGGNTTLQLGGNLVYATGPTDAPVRTVPPQPTGGTAGALYVASADAPASERAKADYVCDGTADQVQIQAAIDAVQAVGGGVVVLSGGGFQIAAPLEVNGTLDENNPRTVTLRGCGQQVTELNVAAGVVGILISDWAQIHLSDLGLFISGAGIGIRSVGVNNVANSDTISFWHSSFKNLRVNGGFDAASTTWAMELGMPWRSVFENIEVEGCRNGIKVINNSAVQNAGDCVFSRFFVEIVGTGGYALYIESIDGNMNQNTWIDFEAGANSTGCTGIWLGGAAGTASQRFIGNLNLEQFQTLINVANGESNVFECNFVTCDSGGATNKGFVTGADSYNNVFRASYFNIGNNDTVRVIEDLNTTSNAPNIFERIRLENNTNGTVTYTRASSSVLRDITTFNTGNAMPAGLLQYPLPVVNDAAFHPSDQGLIAWTHDPATLRSASNATVSGTVYLMKVKIVNRSTVVSNVHIGLETAGSGLTAGQSLVGLYDSSGARLAVSADQSAAWATSGTKTIPLTAPPTLAVGSYYVAVLCVGTTPPQLAMGAGGTTNINTGLTTATARFLTGPTAQTALPASIALGSQTQNSGGRWAALS